MCFSLTKVPELTAFLWTHTPESCIHLPLSATQNALSTRWWWQRLTEDNLRAAPPAPSPFRSDVHWNPSSTNTLTLTYLISKNRLSAERIHVSGPLRLTADISASLLTSFPPIPSLFFPCEFSNGKFLSQMEKWVWIKYSQLPRDEGQL